MNIIQDWILTIADAWWLHLVVYVLAALDGFFPAVPSESVIVTLSSLWSSSGSPAIWFVALAAWLGALTGDNLGYLIGRTVGVERFRFLREGKGRAAVATAEKGLEKRALLFLMTARYIPFGRTAVNLVAGAVGYPHRKFWHRSLASTFVWAVYSCAIGAIAGSWFENNHLLAVVVAVVLAVVVALIVERLVSLLHRVLDRRADRRAAKAAEQEAEAAQAAAPAPAAGAAAPPAPGAVTMAAAATAPSPSASESTPPTPEPVDEEIVP